MKQIKPQVWLSANENFPKSVTIDVEQQRPNKKAVHLQPLCAIGSWVSVMAGSVFGHWSSSSSGPWLGCCPPHPPLWQESVGHSQTSACSLHSDHEDWPCAHVPGNLTFGCKLRKEEGWKRMGGGKGQINRQIIKHEMEINMYLTNVWLKLLWWLILDLQVPFLQSLLNSSSKTIIFVVGVVVMIWNHNLLGSSLVEAPKTVLYFFQKLHQKTIMQHKPHSKVSTKVASNILKQDSLTTLLLLLPSVWSSLTTFPCTFLALMQRPRIYKINSLWAEQFYTNSFKDENSVSWSSKFMLDVYTVLWAHAW